MDAVDQPVTDAGEVPMRVAAPRLSVKLSAVLAAICVVDVASAQTQAPISFGAAAAANSSSSTFAWVIGLACGVALMVALNIDWRTLPVRTVAWLRLQRHAAAWAALGALSLAIILFY